MKYYMFIDESGEANISKPDPRFNIFVVCGIVFREDHYTVFNEHLNQIKQKYFGHTNIIFHSFEMRSKKGIFKIFLDEKIMQAFYVDIGSLFTQNKYHVISCVVNKEKYKDKYPHKNHAYEDALTFICERALGLIGGKNKSSILHLCLEKRQNSKDEQLKTYYSNFVKYGTQFVSTDVFEICHPELHFRGKQENVNGLQMADLCAYPIARKFLTPENKQPTFDLLEPKLYCNYYGGYNGIGIKHFP